MFLTNPVVICDETICSVDEGRDVDVVYLDFSKAIDMISHNILVHKLVKIRIGQADHRTGGK